MQFSQRAWDKQCEMAYIGLESLDLTLFRDLTQLLQWHRRSIRKWLAIVLLRTWAHNVGFEVFTEVVMKSIIFWVMTPGSLFELQPTFRRNISPPSWGSKKLFQQEPASKQVTSTCSSETSVATQETTRRHISEDDTLHGLTRSDSFQAR
jgi:hypothetical protein